MQSAELTCRAVVCFSNCIFRFSLAFLREWVYNVLTTLFYFLKEMYLWQDFVLTAATKLAKMQLFA